MRLMHDEPNTERGKDRGGFCCTHTNKQTAGAHIGSSPTAAVVRRQLLASWGSVSAFVAGLVVDALFG